MTSNTTNFAVTAGRAAARCQGLSLLILRVTAGGFLVWEVLDNILDPARMHEFVEFLAVHGYPWPIGLAPLSVWFQFLAGTALLAGLWTRRVAVLIALHFLLAWVTIHLDEPLRSGWPALALVAMSAVLAAHGAGVWSLDAWRQARRTAGNR